jgi:protein-L-isoaspartate(D-aspartate) O-methyltransferase
MVRNQLRARGLRDLRVLAAMQWVPREQFIPPNLSRHAYDDQPISVAAGQTISQPYIVGLMTEALALTHADRVLEIGAGTGYQTAVLALLAREVCAVERLEVLLEPARARLARLGFRNVRWRLGDGAIGWPQTAPFAGVLVAAAAPTLPTALADQLAEGGRLVIPLGSRDEQDLVLVRRRGDRFSERSLGPVRFVPMVSPHAFQSAPR